MSRNTENDLIEQYLDRAIPLPKGFGPKAWKERKRVQKERTQMARGLQDLPLHIIQRIASGKGNVMIC